MKLTIDTTADQDFALDYRSKDSGSDSATVLQTIVSAQLDGIVASVRSELQAAQPEQPLADLASQVSLAQAQIKGQ